MNLNKKRTGLYILIVVLIFFITAGIVNKYNNRKTDTVTTSDQNTADKKSFSKDIPVKSQKKVAFKSNEEIKKEYGKLESVYLWNGRSYTGAVISTTEIYTIVTVEGTINIPMKDVKMREIIR